MRIIQLHALECIQISCQHPIIEKRKLRVRVAQVHKAGKRVGGIGTQTP